MAHPFLWVFGYRYITLSCEQLPRLINLCTELGASYRDVKIQGDRAGMCVPFFGYARLLRGALRCGIELECEAQHGLPVSLLAAARRPGIVCGLIAAVLIVFFSSRVVWDVRIHSDGEVDEVALAEHLEECGYYIGAAIPKGGLRESENKLLLQSDDLSWISINVFGTIISVEARADKDLPSKLETTEASNLVASHSGVVMELRDIRGSCELGVGEAVSEGQLLVGGIYGDEEMGFRYTHAKGEVFAAVSRSESVSVPRKYEKKVYTGRQKCEKYLIFFKKEIKIFSNCRNLYPEYDKIEVEEYMPSVDGENLPVGVRTLRYVEYVSEEREYSDEELASVASEAMKQRLEGILSGAELLSRNDDTRIDANGCILYTKVRTIENIARRRFIEIEK